MFIGMAPTGRFSEGTFSGAGFSGEGFSGVGFSGVGLSSGADGSGSFESVDKASPFGKQDRIHPPSHADPEYKGVQLNVLTEGRYYKNPYEWSCQVVPQVEIPDKTFGVRIRMYGEDLPTGELIARKENQKESSPKCSIPAVTRSMPMWSVKSAEREKFRRNHRAARARDDRCRL